MYSSRRFPLFVSEFCLKNFLASEQYFFRLVIREKKWLNVKLFSLVYSWLGNSIIPFSICPFGKILAKIEKLLTAFLWSFALISLHHFTAGLQKLIATHSTEIYVILTTFSSSAKPFRKNVCAGKTQAQITFRFIIFDILPYNGTMAIRQSHSHATYSKYVQIERWATYYS